MSSYWNYHLVFVHLIVIVIGSSFVFVPGNLGMDNDLCNQRKLLCDQVFYCPYEDDEIDCEGTTANDRVSGNLTAGEVGQTTLSTLEPSTSSTETSTEASPTTSTSPPLQSSSVELPVTRTTPSNASWVTRANQTQRSTQFTQKPTSIDQARTTDFVYVKRIPSRTVNSRGNLTAGGVEQTTLSTLEPSTSSTETSIEASSTTSMSPTLQSPSVELPVTRTTSSNATSVTRPPVRTHSSLQTVRTTVNGSTTRANQTQRTTRLTQTPTPLDPTTSKEVRHNSTVNSHRNISAEGTEQTTLSTLEHSTSTEASPTVRTSQTRTVREIISITPSVGPVSGGTEIIIKGPNVNVDILSVFIAGRPCNITDNEKTHFTICYTSRVDEPIESAITMVYNNGNLTSDRVFSYKPDPEIFAITPLKQFQMGGQKQTIRGENLNIIGRPVFVVTAVKNASSLKFNSSCKAENSTTMICLSPNISFRDQNNSNAVSGMKDMQTKEDRQNTTAKVKRDVEDDCIAITSSYVSGEYVEFTIGFYLDGVEKWRPQNIGRYLDKKYTTYAVMEDPVINKFPGENNIYSIGEDSQYLVITGERLNCGAQKEDFTVEVGLDYCHPIISLHSRQLTCKPPGKKPPLKFGNEANYGHPHVRVKIGNVWHDIGYLRYVVVQPWMLALAVISAFVLIVAVTLTVVFLLRRNSRHRRYKLYGVPVTEEEYIGLRPIEAEAKESTKRKGKDTTFPTLDLELQLRVKDVIIESERLILRNDIILGRGCFGVVMSGNLQTTPSSECTPGYMGLRQEVAVKLLKHNADQDELVNFLEEGLMMKDLQHPNVLTLIGICIDDRGVPMIILPYMKFGNLKTFIQDEDRVFTVKDLIMFGHQVASGMCYLSEIHRMVHRDLAARNCMVDETKTVKVGDFGLSRDVYESDYYKGKDNNAKLPAKWMAPECFIEQHYDTKTDVWAYGVLLWELMTRGQTPYPAIDNWDLVDYLQMGKRLQKPPYTPDELYDVMHACWRLDPNLRPDFKGIVEMLDDIIKSAAKESESDDYMTLIQSTYDYVYSHWQGAPK